MIGTSVLMLATLMACDQMIDFSLIHSAKQVVAACTVRNGKSTLFWKDIWNGSLLGQQHPELLSFVKTDLTSIHSAKQVVDISSLFHILLSAQAYDQFQQVQQLFHDLVLSPDEDSWHYILNSPQSKVPPYFNWLWAST